MESDLIQTALANLTLPDYFPDWLFSQNSMADEVGVGVVAVDFEHHRIRPDGRSWRRKWEASQ